MVITMKVSEFKLRLMTTANELIDVYFGDSTVADKMINSTLKILVKNNIHKADDIINLFADKNGEINVNEIVDEYAKQLGDEGVQFDIKDYIKNDFIKSLMPNKFLLITKDDLMKLLR